MLFAHNNYQTALYEIMNDRMNRTTVGPAFPLAELITNPTFTPVLATLNNVVPTFGLKISFIIANQTGISRLKGTTSIPFYTTQLEEGIPQEKSMIELLCKQLFNVKTLHQHNWGHCAISFPEITYTASVISGARGSWAGHFAPVQH